jgi:SAM-dependent methyltransferase
MREAAGRDLCETLGEILKKEPAFLRGLEGVLTTPIDDQDTMCDGDLGYYARCGRSALDMLELSRQCLGKKKQKIARVLDFGCGYGRVARWLCAAYPAAQVVGIDVDSNAVQSVARDLGMRAQLVEADWSNLPKERFDVVWIGALFNHLTEERVGELLTRTFDLLMPGGLVGITTHGAHVANRIRSGEKRYGLTEEQSKVLIGAYEQKAFGFVTYERMPQFGISIIKPARIMEFMGAARLTPLLFVERGWVGHHDYFAGYR